MNEQEKSLALARLMGWQPYSNGRIITVTVNQYPINDVYLQPYDSCKEGLAQFAAILLKFPEVIPRVCAFDDIDNIVKLKRNWNGVRPTQANMLDEILTMNGVEI